MKVGVVLLAAVQIQVRSRTGGRNDIPPSIEVIRVRNRSGDPSAYERCRSPSYP